VSHGRWELPDAAFTHNANGSWQRDGLGVLRDSTPPVISRLPNFLLELQAVAV
jgi:hypothetical protein